MENHALMVANYTTGETLAINEVNSHTMGAIKRGVHFMLKRDKTEDIRVFKANNANMILHMENYIKKVKSHQK